MHLNSVALPDHTDVPPPCVLSILTPAHATSIPSLGFPTSLQSAFRGEIFFGIFFPQRAEKGGPSYALDLFIVPLLTVLLVLGISLDLASCSWTMHHPPSGEALERVDPYDGRTTSPCYTAL
jgi:hypothetical protein